MEKSEAVSMLAFSDGDKDTSYVFQVEAYMFEGMLSSEHQRSTRDQDKCERTPQLGYVEKEDTETFNRLEQEKASWEQDEKR